MWVLLHICCQTKSISSGLRCVISGLCNVLRICSLADSVLNIQISVSLFQLMIWRQHHVRYGAPMLPNRGYTIRFSLRELWSLSNPAHMQFCRFCLKYSNQRMSVTIADVTTVRCASYSISAAKYRLHHPVCATWTMVTVKSNLYTICRFCL